MTKTDLITALTTLGYKKIPKIMNIKDSAASQLDFYYTLYPIAINDNIEETGHTRQYEMQVKYVTRDDEERDTKFEDFVSLRKALDGGDVVLVNGAKFENSKITDQTSIGTFQFYLIQ